MLVKNWMSQPAITVDADAGAEEAFRLTKRHQIHMLPVMQNGQLVGIVTDRDIHSISASDVFLEKIGEARNLLSDLKVKEIMTPDPVTILYDYTLEETVEKFLVHGISGLPVVDAHREVIGVITKSDLFQLILILTGHGKKGLQFGIELEDRPGCLKEITDMMRDYGGRISSILSTDGRADRGNRRLYIRVFDIDRPGLQQLKEVIQESAALLYIIDYNGKTREIF
jgi:acetoin utilization protein AcuB